MNMKFDEDPKSITFPCIKVSQPIGAFYIASIESHKLCDITDFDVRRIFQDKRGFETYLGIQRPLVPKRVKEISSYVNTIDATFPTAVILAVPAVCAEFDESKNKMTLSNYPNPGEGEETILYKSIAKVLDGQHRIEGLKSFSDETFEINVSIFIDIDLADQAYIFSTVNLAQTKVNKSLAFDLYELAKTKSPQKMCHNIAVALDKTPDSPFFKKIKRLGVSTFGRFNETITQATFIQSLIVYVCKDEIEQETDRDHYKRGRKKLPLVTGDEANKYIFRNMFIEDKELKITDIIWNYFDAVEERWPDAWGSTDTGIMLNKTNGFRALMRLLRPAYLDITGSDSETNKDEFLKIFKKIGLKDKDFNTDAFQPGSSGESQLYQALMNGSQINP